MSWRIFGGWDDLHIDIWIRRLYCVCAGTADLTWIPYRGLLEIAAVL
jgi:hypothetical protein